MRISRPIAFLWAGAAALLAYSVALSAQTLETPQSLTVPSGFQIVTIARVPSARELAALPNGDLIAGTGGNSVYIVPNAEDGAAAGSTQVFATLPDGRAAGVAFAAALRVIYFGTEHGIYATNYSSGQRAASAVTLVARVRTGPVAPNSDGDVHLTTSVVYAGDTLYASVGSSCNACTEADSTRASILGIPPHGGTPVKRATRIRNAIALAANPETQSLWAGDAGQDSLPFGHP